MVNIFAGVIIYVSTMSYIMLNQELLWMVPLLECIISDTDTCKLVNQSHLMNSYYLNEFLTNKNV